MSVRFGRAFNVKNNNEQQWNINDTTTRSLNLIIKSKRKSCGFSCVWLCGDAIYLLNNREILSPSPMLRNPVMSVTHCRRPTCATKTTHRTKAKLRLEHFWEQSRQDGDPFYSVTSFYIIFLYTYNMNNFDAQQNANKTIINKNKNWNNGQRQRAEQFQIKSERFNNSILNDAVWVPQIQRYGMSESKCECILFEGGNEFASSNRCIF